MFSCHSSQGSWKLLGQWVQLSYKKLAWKLELFIQASLIASGERGTGLSGGMFGYLGWITMGRLSSWAGVRRIPSIVEKGQESIFTCLPTLQARIHLPAPFNKILSNKECLSCVAGKSPGGASFLCPVFLQSRGVLKSTLSGGSRSGLCPYFIRIQTLSAVLARTFLEHPPNNSISLDVISKEKTQGLD